MNRRANLVFAFLMACAPRVEPTGNYFAPITAAAAASGGEATCAAGDRWEVCLVFTRGLLTFASIDETRNEGITMVLELEGIAEPMEIDLELPPTQGIRWDGGTLEAQFLDRDADEMNVGGVSSGFRRVGG